MFKMQTDVEFDYYDVDINTKVISIPYNVLITCIRLGALPRFKKLTHLYIFKKPISALPEDIGLVSTLEHLECWRTKLTSVPTSIGNLNNLKSIMLVDNKLTSVPTSIGNLNNLKSLILSDNKLTIFPSVTNCNSLQCLSLSSNQITDIPDSLGSLENSIISLNMYNNKLVKFPDSLTKCNKISSLSLDSNNISQVPHLIGNMTSLEYLNLSGNKIRFMPASLAKLQATIVVLNLENNPIEEFGHEGNLGKRDLLAIFKYKVKFSKRIFDYSRTEQQVLDEFSKRYFFWNLEKLKLLINGGTLSTPTFSKQEMIRSFDQISDCSQNTDLVWPKAVAPSAPPTGASRPLVVNIWRCGSSFLKGKDILRKYIKKLYDHEKEYEQWMIRNECISETKTILEAIFRKFIILKATTSVSEYIYILEKNIKRMRDALDDSPIHRVVEFRSIYNCLPKKYSDKNLTQIIENKVAFLKEIFFDKIFTSDTQALYHWKYKFRKTLGFDFDFKTDDLYSIPFKGNKAKALDDFLTCFMPEIIINKLTEEVNADTQYFCKVAEYIYTSKALETEKKGWVELEDKEGCISCDKFLNIVKIHSSFIEHLLIEMELLKKS
jgi:hypothetical protein